MKVERTGGERAGAEGTDAERARQLRNMKLIALGLLVGAAVVYVIATLAGADGVWGYVQSFAEAAMVGALADWFAVTALFRHPLGLPIPHTAIIPNRKDQIGASLGRFVEENFLTVDVINERLAGAQLARRAGDWLATPNNAARASGAIGDGLGAVLDGIDDSEVQRSLESAVTSRIEQVEITPIAANLIEASIEDGYASRLIDAALNAVDNFMGDSRATFQRRIQEESPWWVPPSLDRVVLNKIYDIVQRFTAEVRADPDHEIRRTAEQRLALFAQRLRDDPELIVRGEQLKTEVLQHPQVRAWIESMWSRLKAAIIEMGHDPDSELRVSLAATIEKFGHRLATDPKTQADADAWASRGVAYLVSNYRSEVSELIESTVQRWDAASTSERVELQVGRDLQFIRINGTIVGGLAGLAIHAITQLL